MFDISALTGPALSGPRSILRVVQVFERLGAHPEGQTLSQLCTGLALPKTTLFTMLKVLEKADYLRNEGGVYRLGTAAVTLGMSMAESPRRDFPNCAKGVVEALAQRTGETCFLAVLTADRQFCQYVSVVETEQWLRFSVKLGSLKPAYATGSGRAMLAYLPAEETASLLNSFPYEHLTSRTVASRTALARALKEVRKTGVSTVEGGTVAGVTSVAAPIFGVDGKVAAALSVGGPSARLLDRLAGIQKAARDGAEDISRILGYVGAWPAEPTGG
jgi:DNA-binding IclR family transcriptional regulator